jgi:hypothetical protein
MMKTKEIEVWVVMDHEQPIKMWSAKPKCRNEIDEMGWVKARLIIEIPERKVEITESEFDEVMKDLRLECPERVWLVKKELFGKEKT